jgi:hypothetical protein
LRSRAGRARRENTDAGEDLKPIRSFCMAAALAGISGTACVQAQEPTSKLEPSQERTVRWENVSLVGRDPQQASTTTDGKSSAADAPAPKVNPVDPNKPDDQEGKQSKRILWIIPNYRAVSANTHLPALSFKEKFWLGTEDTFDYSNFVLVGGLAGLSMAQKSQPSFGQGGAGYGRYYWHNFVDGAVENYMVEAIIPTLTKEDPEILHTGQRWIHQADRLCS